MDTSYYIFVFLPSYRPVYEIEIVAVSWYLIHVDRCHRIWPITAAITTVCMQIKGEKLDHICKNHTHWLCAHHKS